VRMAGAGVGSVAGDGALGVVGNRRPITARTATPSTTAAAGANRLDDLHMLSSTDAIWWFLIIVTEAAGGRGVYRHEPPLAAVLPQRGIAGPAAHGNAARTDPLLTIRAAALPIVGSAEVKWPGVSVVDRGEPVASCPVWHGEGTPGGAN